jgi:hypothetical protein
MSKSLVAILIALVCTSSLAIAVSPSYGNVTDNSWKELAPMHQARLSLGVIAVDGKIYAIGGTAASSYSSVLNTNEQYDPATNTWVYKASMPTARASFAVAAYEKKIYCFGGIIGMRSADDLIKGFYTTNDSNVVEEYDITSDTWAVKTHMPKGGGGYMSAQEINGKIYVIDSPYVHVYDPINDTWAERDNLPLQRYSVVIDGKIIATNSQDVWNASSPYFGDTVQQVMVYDPKSNNITHGSDNINAIVAGSVGATSGIYAPKRVYIMGVKVNTSPDIPESQAYDPITDSWTVAKTMPTTRVEFGVAVINDTLYAVGGLLLSYTYDSTGKYVTRADASPTNINEQYTPIGYGTIQPQISLLLPEFEVYNSSTISLDFSVDKPFIELSYSLDGKDNSTIAGNTTITGLVNGNHTLTIYAKDGFGNIGNQTVNFTINNPQTGILGSPVTIVIIAILVAIVCLIVGLLLYRRRRKTSKLK